MTTTTGDLWDKLDNGSYWQKMPAADATQYISGETDDIFVTHEHGRWWVSRSSNVGADDHASLAEAKEAGQKIIDAANEAMEENILDSLSNYSDRWTISIEGGTVLLTSTENDKATIFGSEGSPKWIAEVDAEGENKVLARTDYLNSAVAAAEVWIKKDRASPGPGPRL
jgi:predicted secreted protein